jgi:Nucleotidyl transferase AbiEii toxin, Type IV TA system
MATDYLHNHLDFRDLLGIVSAEKSIAPNLIEKDYWIMHCLFGLQTLGMNFQMKGGTSLSKGFNLINRFSEDIDILIEPPKKITVYTGRNHDKPFHRQSRLSYYNWLAEHITMTVLLTFAATASLMMKNIEAAG